MVLNKFRLSAPSITESMDPEEDDGHSLLPPPGELLFPSYGKSLEG